MKLLMTTIEGIVALCIVFIILFCFACVVHVAIELMFEVIDEQMKEDDKNTDNKN